MNVPKKQRSNVALWGWKVHAIEACWVGSVMHFWKVLMAVTVVQWVETTVSKWEEKRKKKGRMKGRIMVVEERLLRLEIEWRWYIHLMMLRLQCNNENDGS
ncbi:hypothetical protein SLA2020_200440 [Shorea laevis]